MEQENNESLNSDVSSEVSSAPQESANQSASAESNSEAKPNESQSPFHEHPRFKEIIEQKNQLKTQFEASQKQIDALQRQVQEFTSRKEISQKQEDALIARLKGIDPEFGDRFAKVDSTAQEVAQLKAQLRNYEVQQLRERAESTIKGLHEANKVPEALQTFYRARIEAECMKNPQLQVEDLPKVYKDIHDSLSGYVEAQKREALKQYTTDKKKDSSTPTSQPKGKAPALPGKQFSKNPEVARQEMVQQILKLAKADRNI
jgi:uncharacterized coiled-coil DUF342 family protein